jgi:hypothetical protein
MERINWPGRSAGHFFFAEIVGRPMFLGIVETA